MLGGITDRATPRPWQLDEDGDVSHGSMHIAHVTQAEEHPRLRDDGLGREALQAECEANGRLIIAAVNRFDDLRGERDALATALDALIAMTGRYLADAGDAAAVRAALTTAEATLLAMREHPPDEG